MSFYLNPASVPDWHDGLLGLMYHAVEAPPLFHGLRGLYVEPSLLDAQIAELKATGATFTTLTDWAHKRTAGRCVAVTFDDAFQNVFDHALPVLKKHGVTSVTYVVAQEIGGTNRWDTDLNAQMRPLMDRATLLAWQAAGQEIGSHGLRHVALAEIPLAQARTEIFDSKKTLEDLAGRAVRHFCYPYGSWNQNVRDLVEEAGYETATTVEPGTNAPGADPFTLRRHLAAHARPWRTALKHRLLHPLGGARRARPR
jgi:peptidoglycan/xylan/chitin deacetylase (PgdA/CDA1 family)